MRNLFLLLGFMLWVGCSSNKKQSALNETSDGIPVINLSDNVSKVSSLPLSDAAAKVESVCLEATSESLIGDIYMVQVTDNDIWVRHYKDNRILRFSRSGRFLNKVGNIGQGPGEYVDISESFIDEDHKEIYIVSTNILVYDFDGNFKRNAVGYTHLNKFASGSTQHVLFKNNFYVAQNISLYRPVPEDSLWSFARVDSSFCLKKIFKNPAHKGREKDIIKNRAQMDYYANYWKEFLTNIDTYGHQLTLKYPDTDTIYQYDVTHQNLTPQYAIYTNEDKGDYELTHLWFQERKAFDYFSICYYYPSKDYIYLVGSKGDKILTYCYDKQDGSVRVQEQKGEITERKVPWFDILYRRLERPFILNNDLSGGQFTVDYRSQGKYWVNVLEGVEEEEEEGGNPILVIATLK